MVGRELVKTLLCSAGFMAKIGIQRLTNFPLELKLMSEVGQALPCQAEPNGIERNGSSRRKAVGNVPR
jgi:hypothetical protein